MKINSLIIPGLLTVGLLLSCESLTDIYPPELKWISPIEKILSADSVTFSVDVKDNITVDRVEFTLRDPFTGEEIEESIRHDPYQYQLYGVQSWKQIDLIVTAYDDVGNFAELERNFLIQSSVENARITVTSPNGGEIWVTDATETITWSSSDVSGDVDIELYKDANLVEIIKSSTKNDGVYRWNIPDNLDNSTDYMIKILWESNTDIFDYSDETFTIHKAGETITITRPEEGEVWYRGTTEEITWIDNENLGSSHSLDIDLYRSSSFIQRITATTSNDGSYYWFIPSEVTEATNYVIKIVQASSGEVYGVSSPFAIKEQETSSNLSVVDVSVSPNSIPAGEDVEIAFSISNSGFSTIFSASAEIFLSTSIWENSSGIEIFDGSFSEGIDPGTSYWIASDVTIPNSTSSGIYYLFVVLEYEDQNQDDNYAYTFLTVTPGQLGNSMR
ncbi:MAG: Ser-Thr-rich GPI-anchored membrane family protein [Fidelibacterota bacterium]